MTMGRIKRRPPGCVMLGGRAQCEGERVQAALELIGQQSVHPAMAFDARNTGEPFGHERDVVMRLDATLVSLTLIQDLQEGGFEKGQCLNETLFAHQGSNTAARPFGCQTPCG